MLKKAIQTTIVLLLFLSPAILIAQDFGEISNEELLMNGIDEDPEANAVILFDKAVIKITPNFYLDMEIHKRIKIFTEAGKEYANVEIPYYNEDKIRNLKAIAYTIDGKEHKLDDDNIYEEKGKYWNKKVFAIPGVETGAVIEYKYVLFSEYIHRLEPWFFQSHEFTKLSEIAVYLPRGFTYSVLSMNGRAYAIAENQEETFDPYDLSKKCAKYTWTATNIPAIRKEPYMTAFGDYYAQLLFQLVAYRDAYNFISFAKKWDDVSKQVWDRYDGYIHQDKGLEEFTLSLVNETDTAQKKIEKIYEYVRSEIRTTENTGLYGEDFKEPKEVFETREGSTNEKNVLLMNLLNHAGFNAQPLLISTTENGLINPGWVQLQQFNRAIVYLELNDEKLVMNAGSRYCPFGYLSPAYDVGQGLLINEKTGAIVSFTPQQPENKVEIETEAMLHDDGNLSAHSILTFAGMDAVMERDRIEEKDLREYLEDKLNDLHSEAELDSFAYTDTDSIHKPLILDLYYHVPEYAEISGTMVYFSPPLLTREDENPFVREKRNFPVDFSYDFRKSETVKIQLSPAYKIMEKPRVTRGRMENFSFTKIYFSGENSVECHRKFNLGRKQFNPGEYPELKSIYEKIVISDQDQIVLSVE